MRATVSHGQPPAAAAPAAPRETGSCPVTGSLAEGSPVTHDHDKAVSLDAPQCRNDGAARYAVLLSQLSHRGQTLLSLPFARVNSFTQRGLNTPARRLGRAVNWHSPMIANAV